MIRTPAGIGDIRIKQFLDGYKSGYGVAVTAPVASVFSPIELFAFGEQGGWYDPSDLSSLYQDSAGTTPVTAVEQFVGRMSDKSGQNNHLTQSVSGARPRLSARVNALVGTDTLSTQTADLTVVSVAGVTSNWTLQFSGAGTVTIGGVTYSAGVNTISITSTATLTVTVAGVVTEADLRPADTGVNLPTYQRVVSSTDYTTSGFPYYLRFDGAATWMETANINPGNVSRAQLFIGLRKLTSVQGMIVEFSNSFGVNNGVFNLQANATAINYFANSKGTANPGGASDVIASPNTAVLSGLFSISDNGLVMRRNGSQTASNTASQGTGNYLTYPLYVGARYSTSRILFFSGNIYALAVRFSSGALPLATISQMESWVNGKTYAY